MRVVEFFNVSTSRALENLDKTTLEFTKFQFNFYLSFSFFYITNSIQNLSRQFGPTKEGR